MTVAVWSLPELWRRHVASGFRLCVLSPRSSSSSLSSPHFHFTSPPPSHLLPPHTSSFFLSSYFFVSVSSLFDRLSCLRFLPPLLNLRRHLLRQHHSFVYIFFLFFIFPFLPPPCLYVGVQFHLVINVSLSLMEEMVLSPVNSPRGSKHRVLSCGRLGYKATTIQPGIISNKNFSGLDVNQSLLSNNDFIQITSSKNSTNIFLLHRLSRFLSSHIYN